MSRQYLTLNFSESIKAGENQVSTDTYLRNTYNFVSINTYWKLTLPQT